MGKVITKTKTMNVSTANRRHSLTRPPTVDNATVKEIMSHRYATPYMLTDLSIIGEKLNQFQKLLPDFEVFYAVKSNNDKKIISYLNKKIDGFDVASIGEIKQLVKEGVKPAKMLFGNPVKPAKAIKVAHKLGIKAFTFQSVDELQKLKKFAPGSSVYLRLSVDEAKGAFAFAVSNEKFGASQNKAINLMKEAKKLGLKPFGLSFHVGSQMSSPKAWSHALRQCFDLLTQLSDLGINVKFVDIGGGFPVYYGPSQPGCDFREIAKNLNNLIRRSKPADIRLIAEPGRFLVAEASKVITTVIGQEQRANKKWLIVDVSIFHAFMERFGFNAFPFPIYDLKSLTLPTKPNKQKVYAIGGPTCDSFDIMNTATRLPSDIKTGDRLLIGVAGAYSLVYASRFNGFNVPLNHFYQSRNSK